VSIREIAGVVHARVWQTFFLNLFIENSQYLQRTTFITSNYTNKQQQQQQKTHKNLQIKVTVFFIINVYTYYLRKEKWKKKT